MEKPSETIQVRSFNDLGQYVGRIASASILFRDGSGNVMPDLKKGRKYGTLEQMPTRSESAPAAPVEPAYGFTVINNEPGEGDYVMIDEKNFSARGVEVEN